MSTVNIRDLMLARATSRAREISVRIAVGAGRWRIVRQLLVESVMVSSLGGILGWFIAIWGTRAFDLATTPFGKPQWIDFSMDYRAFVHLAVVSVGTGILSGLAPALAYPTRFSLGAQSRRARRQQAARGDAGFPACWWPLNSPWPWCS